MNNTSPTPLPYLEEWYNKKTKKSHVIATMNNNNLVYATIKTANSIAEEGVHRSLKKELMRRLNSKHENN